MFFIRLFFFFYLLTKPVKSLVLLEAIISVSCCQLLSYWFAHFMILYILMHSQKLKQQACNFSKYWGQEGCTCTCAAIVFKVKLIFKSFIFYIFMNLNVGLSVPNKKTLREHQTNMTLFLITVQRASAKCDT